MSIRNLERRAKKTQSKSATFNPATDRADLKRLIDGHDGNITIIGKDGVVIRSIARK